MPFQKSPFAFDLCLGSGHLLDQVVIGEACHQSHPTLKSQVFAFPGILLLLPLPCKSSALRFPLEKAINIG